MTPFASQRDEVITNINQLMGFFVASEKPKTEWRVGVEQEKFVYRLSSLTPVGYKEKGGVREILQALTLYGWRPVLENEHLLGMERGRSFISLEPGSQVELDTAPHITIHELASEVDQHITELNEIGKLLDIGFLGLGFQPTATREMIDWIPKARHHIMRRHMEAEGTLGLDMMLRTSAIQASYDYSSEKDMVQKMRVAQALQPLTTILFASSPYKEGKLTGFKSTRMHVWTDTDARRCGPLPFVYDDNFGYARYIQHALEVPLYFIVRNGVYQPTSGETFWQFMEGRLKDYPEERPRLADWINHLSTLFPPVRLKNILEMRGADAGPTEMTCALAAFWTGLLYDQSSLDEATAIISSWTADDHAAFAKESYEKGFDTVVKGRPIAELALSIVTMAKHGLRRRSHRLFGMSDESRYLEPLFDIIDAKQTLADQLIMKATYYQDFSIRTIFDAGRLIPSASLNT